MTSLLGGIGGAIGGILGGVNKPAPTINFTPAGFNAGGLSASFANNQYTVSPDASRMAAVGGVASTFGQQGDILGQLRSQFAPGFSNLRQAQLANFQANRTAGLGNLRDNLAQRRILGSSFAQNSLATADQEYQKQQSDMLAQTYLQELSASQQIVQQQFEAYRGQFQTSLNEMNLEAGIASDLTGKASALLQNTASTQAQLDAAFQANKAKFWAGEGATLGSGIGQAASMFI